MNVFRKSSGSQDGRVSTGSENIFPNDELQFCRIPISNITQSHETGRCFSSVTTTMNRHYC
jgi:hypothetical protein